MYRRTDRQTDKLIRVELGNLFGSSRLNWFFQTWHIDFWRKRKTDENFGEGVKIWLMFTNTQSTIDRYQSDAKWVGEQKGIMDFCLNSIAANLLIISRSHRVQSSITVCPVFFRSRQKSKCQVWKKSVLNNVSIKRSRFLQVTISTIVERSQN